MQVFKVVPKVPYSGGVVLVAAHSKQEVVDYLSKDEYYNTYADLEAISEIENLKANVDTLTVLLYAWYME